MSAQLDPSPAETGVKPAADLGPFGCLAHAPAQAVADTVVSVHVGETRLASLAKERLRWVLGISKEDGARLGVAIAQYRGVFQLVTHVSVKGEAYWKRARRDPVDYSLNSTPEPVRSVDMAGVMSGADKRAARAEEAHREAKLRQLIDEHLASKESS